MRLRARPRFFLTLISAMILAFCISFAVSQRSLSAGERELADANAERSALLDEVEALSAQLEFAQTDEYVVRVARDELGMLMPGEIRYVSAD